MKAQSLLLALLIGLLFPMQLSYAANPQKHVSLIDSATVEATPVEEKPIEATVVKQPDHTILVSKEPVPIASGRLASQYSGYKLTVQNTGNAAIDIISAQITGGTNGQTGYAMVKKGSGAVWGSVLGAGFVLSIVTFGISFLVALVAWPIIAGVNAGKNSSARKESIKFSDILPLGVVDAGQSVEVLTLVPVGQKPAVKLTFRDMEGKLYSVAR